MTKIRVYDNYAYMDDDAVDAALERCRAMVDEELTCRYEPGMSGKQLFGLYKMFGCDPIIIDADGCPSFSAWDYARKRAAEISGTEVPDDPPRETGGFDLDG
jgi:hypothetical protein